nr:unnamed protein product [Callosobruchus analis]
MARSSSRHAETLKYLLLVLFLQVSGAYVVKDEFVPELNSLEIKSVKENADSKQVTFEVRGRNLQSTTQIKATKIKAEKDSVCEEFDSNFNFSLIENSEATKAQFLLTVPKNVKGVIYFCLPRQVKENSALVPPIFKGEFVRWYHQGPDLSYNLPSSYNASDLHQIRRSLSGGQGGPPVRGSGAIQVYGLRLEHAYKDPDFDENGVPDVLAYKPHQIRLFGEGFTPSMLVTFTAGKDHCLLPAGNIFHVDSDTFSNTTVVLTFTLPPLGGEETFYICVKDGSDDPEKVFIHQGTDIWLQVKTHETLLPMWASILVIFICICFSSLFSGLNLGLMSMDKTELKILCNTGTAKERKYAQTIQPVRAHGNYLLCSILLGNVLVNSIFTILLDGLTSGLFAVVGSTLAIVLFGEISPQAVCSRHGLAVGAHTIWITKAVMALTFPLSYPTAKFLDWMLGEEIGNVYTRERLKELVKVTTGENDLDKDEVNIISGALELRKKTVEEVMTRIEDVFMLDYDAVLDFETVSEIMKSGYSRIPVYEGSRQNIVTVLYIKDLAFVDPDDNTPLKTLCQFYQNPCNFVFEDVTLDVMFKIFKGNKGHMAFVQRVNNEGEGDPFYETIGLITLEDVIEELIQAEIMDETDVFTDNRTKRRRNAERKQDFTIFAEKRGEASKMRISPQLTLAAYQFLSTSVEPFHPNVISETILRRLLKQDIVYHIRKNKEWRTDPGCIIYDQGRAVDYFVIILEGRVEVTVGKESLRFEGGPFTYFGTQALVQTVGISKSFEICG